ncbi:MAG TPA: alanine racemase [Candidatus Bipolaricaulota bacterium]|nr:alanine racemase [Candidatus Bipolaricaulota bacterium]
MFKMLYNRYLSKFERQVATLSRVEILSANILHNFDYFQKENPQAKIFPVLKSNAYGHGLKEVTQILEKRGVEYYVVDSYYEALQIREVTNRKILLIGYTKPENYKNFKWKNLSIAIFDSGSLKAIGNLGKKINIHLFINTGMNREGISMDDLPLYLAELKKYSRINLEGVCSHLADADNEDQSFTESQRQKFSQALTIIEKEGFNPKYRHISATGGSFRIKNPEINAIRLGIGLYGYNPIKPFDANLRPALRLISTIVSVQSLSEGEKVSYNCAFSADKPIKIGILPVGYYEFLDRRLSNLGKVKYENDFLPIVGRVCMNLTAIDLKDHNLKIGDEITIISEHPRDLNSVDSITQQINTISYEILVRVNSSIRRKIK